MSGEISYKTHILVGVRSNGVMTVISDWPHLPKQSDVEKAIDAPRDGYATFALCTPTSILPAGGNGKMAQGAGRTELVRGGVEGSGFN
jgi:hypothetical protein